MKEERERERERERVSENVCVYEREKEYVSGQKESCCYLEVFFKK